MMEEDPPPQGEDDGDPTPEVHPTLLLIAQLIDNYSPLDDIRLALASDGVDVNDTLRRGRTLLHHAIYRRHVEAATLLLVRGANPSVMDEQGHSLMHLAAELGFCNLIRLLLRYNARVDFSKVLSTDIGYGFPPRASPAKEPLRLAFKNGHTRAAELLLTHGANPNAEYHSGFEINFVEPLDNEAVELLLKHGADPNARDIQGLTLLMKACRSPAGLDTARLLLRAGADADATTAEERRTPLHCAALSGSTDIVRMLVDAGASVTLPPDYVQSPPLFFAVLKSDLRMLGCLLELGADVNHASAALGTALHVALSELHHTRAAVAEFLLQNGADPNAILTSGFRTILKPPLGEYFASVAHPDVTIVKAMLKYGARIVLQGQRQHPLGILQTLHNIDPRSEGGVLELIASAAESFCVTLIDRSVLLSQRHKLVLLQRALEPLPLKHCARITVRTVIGWGPSLVAAVDNLDIPVQLKDYLLFQD